MAGTAALAAAAPAGSDGSGFMMLTGGIDAADGKSKRLGTGLLGDGAFGGAPGRLAMAAGGGTGGTGAALATGGSFSVAGGPFFQAAA